VTDPTPGTPGQDPAQPSGQDPSGSGAPAPQGQGPTVPPAPQQGGQDPQGGGQDPKPQLSPEATTAELARARSEVAAERQARKAAEDKVKAFEDEKLSEQQRLEKQAADEKARADASDEALKRERIARAVERAAVRAGIIDPEDATAMVDLNAVTFDDNGQPQADSIDSALAALKERKPHLFGATLPTGSADGGARQPAPVDRDARIREAEQKGDARTSVGLKIQDLEERTATDGRVTPRGQ